jgi:hypothetical protein
MVKGGSASQHYVLALLRSKSSVAVSLHYCGLGTATMVKGASASSSTISSDSANSSSSTSESASSSNSASDNQHYINSVMLKMYSGLDQHYSCFGTTAMAKGGSSKASASASQHFIYFSSITVNKVAMGRSTVLGIGHYYYCYKD